MADDELKQIALVGATEAGKAFPPALFDFLKSVLGSKVFGPAAEQMGEMIGDYAKYYRLKNLINLQDKVTVLLKARGIKNHRSIHPSLAIPLINEASIQDEESLQDKWANLIANAMDPNFKERIDRNHVDKLARLKPESAELLELMRYGYETRGKPIFECKFAVYTLLEDGGYLEESEDGKFEVSSKGFDAVLNILDLGLALAVVPDSHYPSGWVTYKDLEKGTAEKTSLRQSSLTFPVEITLTRIGHEFVRACMSE
jgi:hypothetical protein